MIQLGEYHQRRILVTFQHVDKLLSQSLQVLARSPSELHPHHVQDISPSKHLKIENLIELIRKQMGSFLKRSQIALPDRATHSSWILKTNLTSVEIALEDLHPQKMKGYGDMDPVAARELAQTLQEMGKLVSQLLKALE